VVASGVDRVEFGAQDGKAANERGHGAAPSILVRYERERTPPAGRAD
jgi:hypothetical protein